MTLGVREKVLEKVVWDVTLKLELSLLEPITKEDDVSFLILYFTGGIVARKLRDGWTLEPIDHGGQPHVTGFIKDHELRVLLKDSDLRPIMYEYFSVSEGVRHSILIPYFMDGSSHNLSPVDKWRVISGNLSRGKQPGPLAEQAQKSSHIAQSLSNVNTHMRRITQFYTRQLTSALWSQMESGAKFSNTYDMEISASLHDLYASMGTARDHLAGLIALRLNKPKGIDDLTKLLRGLNVTGDLKDPMVQMLVHKKHILRETNLWARGPELKEIGDLRRRFVHGAPYRSEKDENWGQTGISLRAGEMVIKTYQRRLVASENTTQELLTHVSRDYLYLMSLFREQAVSSGYALDIPVLKEDDIHDLNVTGGEFGTRRRSTRP